MKQYSFSLLRHCLGWLGMDEVTGLEEGGYLEAMLQQVPTIYFGGVILSLAAVGVAWFWGRQKKEIEINEKMTDKEKDESKEEIEETKYNGGGQFEISPDDECEFVPLLSPEEDARVAAEMAPKSQYIPLDPDNPMMQVQNYLRRRRGENIEGESEDDFIGEDIGKYLKPGDLNILEDPRESPSRKGSVMSRVKKARQRALRNAVERDMTADDRLKETMAANQQLARVYSMMRENKELFGEPSFDDVKSQMELYKA